MTVLLFISVEFQSARNERVTIYNQPPLLNFTRYLPRSEADSVQCKIFEATRQRICL